jgi:hypothetical protein
MLRTAAAMALTFGALAWAIFSAALCFFYGSTFWIERFGPFGAFYSAIAAFAVCYFGARALLRAADKLIEPYTGPFDASAYEGAPSDTFYRDWPRYAADVIRNRRYAFYARTRQWDRLRALESEQAALGPASTTAVPEPPHPRRTSMAGRVSFDENRRGSRRTSAKSWRVERWGALDDDEVLGAAS